MSASMSASVDPVYVGIDVSKAKLDACLLPSGQMLVADNNTAGVKQLIELLRRQPRVHRCLLEATGFQRAEPDPGANSADNTANPDDANDKGLSESQRKLCVDVIRLARTAAESAAPQPPALPRLTHPSLADPDAELAELQRLRREGDTSQIP